MSELSFWAELKRRRVYRTAAWYAAFVFVLWQVADLVIPALGLPAWTMKAVIILSAIGFIPALILSWVYDLRTESPSASRGRTRLALALLVVLLFGSTGWWVARKVKPAKPTLSEASLAVFPFTVLAPGNLSYLREGLVDLLSRNLTGTTQLQPLDPSLMLKVTQGKPNDAGTAGSIAREVGAGHFVIGSVSGAGGQIRIDATLYELRGEPSVVTSKTVEGDTTKLFSLVDQLTAALLTELTTGAATEQLTRTAATMTQSLPALKAYLQGEQSYRRGEHRAAIAAFQNATALDSTFVLAQYRLAITYEMNSQHWLAHNAIAPVVAQKARLTLHDQRMVEAFAAYENGRINQAEHDFRAIVTEYPRDLESRVLLAQILTLYTRYRAESQQEAVDLMEGVVEADPRFVCIMCVLGELYMAVGQNDNAEHMFRLGVARRGEDSTKLDPIFTTKLALMRGDTAHARAGLASFDPYFQDGAQYDWWLGNPGVAAIGMGELGVADQILALPRFGRGDPHARAMLASLLHTARGKLRLAEEETRKTLQTAKPLDALDDAYRIVAATPSEFPLPAANEVHDVIARFLPDTSANPINELARAERGMRIFMLGLAASRMGNAPAALAYADSLAVLERDSLGAGNCRNARLVLLADRALRENKPADALTKLESMSLELRPGQLRSWLQMVEYGALLRVPAYIALQRNEDALKWLRYNLHYFGLVQPIGYYGVYERDLATVLDRLGRHAEAVPHYAAFVNAWQNADPELQRQVAAARQRLAELTAK